MTNEEVNNKISFEDFKKVEIRVGQILSAESIPETDKLLKLMVDMGEEAPRQIVSGISEYFPDCSVLINKKCMFVANLEPRMIRGVESNGMILAISTPEGEFSLISPDDNIPAGTLAS